MVYVTTTDVEIRNYAHNRGARGVHFVVPKGSTVTPCNDGTGEYFLSAPYPGVPNFYKFDAEHYGVRIDPRMVSEGV